MGKRFVQGDGWALVRSYGMAILVVGVIITTTPISATSQAVSVTFYVPPGLPPGGDCDPNCGLDPTDVLITTGRLIGTTPGGGGCGTPEATIQGGIVLRYRFGEAAKQTMLFVPTADGGPVKPGTRITALSLAGSCSTADGTSWDTWHGEMD